MKESDILIVSDIHLGCYLCQSGKLNTFLENLNTKHLVINGDLFDNLSAKLNVTQWRTLRILQELALKTKVTWVLGNHDKVKPEIVADIIGVNCVYDLMLESGGKTVFMIHGDVWDGFIHRHKILVRIVDLIYKRLQKFFPRFASKLKQKTKIYAGCCKIVQDGALELAKSKGYDIIVCGHTHNLEHAECDGKHYYNVGSWTSEVCNYLTITNGKCEIGQL